MGKALKPFLVLNFLLACGAAWMSFTLYSQRQVVKARTLLLEDSIRNVASYLKHEEQDSLASSLQVALPADLARMKSQLDNIDKHANITQKDLESTRETLAVTQNTLEATQLELEETQNTLASTRRDLQNTRDELASTQQDLADAKQTIVQKDNQIDGLNGEISSLNSQVQARDDQIADLEVNLEQRTAEYLRAKDLLEACKRGAREEDEISNWRGRSARILEVNDTWKYVVIDKGENDALEMFLEALVHRGDEYIGKIVVTRVEANVAIADIDQTSLLDGATIAKNDTIFFQ